MTSTCLVCGHAQHAPCASCPARHLMAYLTSDPIAALIDAARAMETAAQCVECSTADQISASVARLRSSRLDLTRATEAVIVSTRT